MRPLDRPSLRPLKTKWMQQLEAEQGRPIEDILLDHLQSGLRPTADALGRDPSTIARWCKELLIVYRKGRWEFVGAKGSSDASNALGPLGQSHRLGRRARVAPNATRYWCRRGVLGTSVSTEDGV